MKNRTSSVFCFIVALGVCLAGLGSPAASAQPSAKSLRLKFAIHSPTLHHSYRNLIAPWAAEVEKRTSGRVKVTVYPDQQLGKLPEMYDDLVRGTSDIARILPVFIMGRFPLEGIFHLPFVVPGEVGDPTGTAMRNMIYDKYLSPLYFQDVKILWTGRFGLNNLLMAGTPVRKLEDLKGKVIGFGGGKTPPLVLKALGASPESIQVPDLYTSLERKVVDGILFPIDSLRGYRLSEVVKYVTIIDFGSASNFVAIRKPAWNSLSPADQKIITDMLPWTLEAQAKTYGEDADLAVETGKKAGIQFIELPKNERQRWIDAVRPVDKQWVAEMDNLGLPASRVYNDTLQLMPK